MLQSLALHQYVSVSPTRSKKRLEQKKKHSLLLNADPSTASGRMDSLLCYVLPALPCHSFLTRSTERRKEKNKTSVHTERETYTSLPVTCFEWTHLPPLPSLPPSTLLPPAPPSRYRCVIRKVSRVPYSPCQHLRHHHSGLNGSPATWIDS